MGPGDELAREFLRDRVALDEAGEQALAEQLHHGIGVPALQPVKGAVFAEASIRGQQVSVRVPTSRWESVRREQESTRLLEARSERARGSLHHGGVRAGPAAL
jgi:hypothetical protein